MYKFAPVEAVVPIPMLEVAMRVKRFAVPETFTLVVKMFEVVRALVKKALPTT
jgi:hypothetical protein